MLYNGQKEFDCQRAIERLNFFIKNDKVFELTEKKTKRTLSQNRYLHLILSLYALEYGETLDYIKQEVFKKQVNKQIFQYERVNTKTGEIRIDYRSTTKLNTKELTVAIDRFRDYAAKEAGIYLPEPKDLNYLKEIEILITNNQQYL